MTPHSLFSLANLYVGFYALLSFLFQCNEFISCIDNLFFQVKVLNLFFFVKMANLLFCTFL